MAGNPPDNGDYQGRAGGEMTPLKLRTIANWFDTLDGFALAWARIVEKTSREPDAEVQRVIATLEGKDIQADLRRWADEMEATDAE